jgi:hypothetical protein
MFSIFFLETTQMLILVKKRVWGISVRVYYKRHVQHIF